jgi:hypothetical protein
LSVSAEFLTIFRGFLTIFGTLLSIFGGFQGLFGQSPGGQFAGQGGGSSPRRSAVSLKDPVIHKPFCLGPQFAANLFCHLAIRFFATFATEKARLN